MKKILMFFLALLIILYAKNTFAQEDYHITFEKIEGVYSYRVGENYNNDSHSFYIYHFGDMIAYCLQPGKSFKTYDYVGEEDFVKLNLPSDVQEKIELIGYYGREYPGHNTTRYSMATQALIWELTGVDSVTYWTELNGKGKEIDVSNERREIERLVSKHQQLPNVNKLIKGNVNQEIIITDSNNILNEYEIESSGGNDIDIKDNRLIIVPKVIGESTITLKHKKYDNLDTVIFVSKDGSDSQILGRLRLNVTEKSFDIKLNTKGTKIIVNKVDEENNLIKKEGIKFKIKDIINNKYLDYETNSEGYFITDYIDYGEYELEELDNNLDDYYWNTDKVKITINSETKLKENDNYNYIEINFVNERVKGNLEIHKIGEEAIFKEDEIIYKERDLQDIEFNLYNDKDELIDTIKTNENGKVNYSDLLIGKYYIKEKTNLDEYILNDEKIYFDINKENTLITLEVKNYLKKGILEFNKLDIKTNEGIEDTIIEIYNELGELLFTRITDTHGQVTINNLPKGKYYLIEKEANKLYQLTNEKVYFGIKDNEEIVKTYMYNEKMEIPVFKSDTNESIIFNSLFGICLLIGIGGLYYEKKIS